ncbi:MULTISPECIES: L-histidine N(alpha)-methyltransferase [Bradyrhizobium]|uniref:L-histidine N(alpha)-methyltransferase n=1 Tax=Bradyrhizobium elkanii TaxID=29448 RepID=UPI0003F81302|nr:L-histidine N(alpha)-methyltransferase [Bradyrhizobium elkanii]
MLFRPEDACAGAPAKTDPAFREDVILGLSRRPATIPPRWFYDLRGSELFERITELPEYYPTRPEIEIPTKAACEIAAIGPGRAVVEFGSGSSLKSRILLSAIAPSAYVPIDISGDFLRAAAETLRGEFCGLPVHDVEGDFTRPLSLPNAIESMPRLGFFPGSTIGNLVVDEAVDLLRTMAATLGDGSMLLIGIDRRKDRDTLVAAYDDTQGHHRGLQSKPPAEDQSRT